MPRILCGMPLHPFFAAGGKRCLDRMGVTVSVKE